MALFNYASKELTLKVVYYGPGLSGKTTNIQHLHSVLTPESKGKLLSLATETDRTLFFDFLPVTTGKINDFSVKFQLYTVPGQIRYNSTRKLVLKGADGVVFVADSQREMRQYNKESFQSMMENLRSNGIDPAGIPIVLQYNKRDLKTSMSVEELNGDLNAKGYSVFLASAVKGDGVEETFKGITDILIRDLEKKNATGDGKTEKEAAERTEERPGPERDTLETALENTPSSTVAPDGRSFDPALLQPNLLNARTERHFFDDMNSSAGTLVEEEEKRNENENTLEKCSRGIDLLMAHLEEMQKSLDALVLKTESMTAEQKLQGEQIEALRLDAQKNQSGQDVQPERGETSALATMPPEMEKQVKEIKDVLSKMPGAVLRALSPFIESIAEDLKAREKEATGTVGALASALQELKRLQEESLTQIKQLREEALSTSKKRKGSFSRLFGS